VGFLLEQGLQLDDAEGRAIVIGWLLVVEQQLVTSCIFQDKHHTARHVLVDKGKNIERTVFSLQTYHENHDFRCLSLNLTMVSYL